MNAGQFSLYYELIKGRGEDAEPLVLDSLIGVFDGLHGAGAIEFTTRKGNVTTGAYEGPRLVRSAVQDYYEENKKLFDFALTDSDDAFSIIKRDLTEVIFDRLKEYANENDLGKKITVRSKMLKLLPTTMAVAVVKENKDTVNIMCLWAGDSRCYVLSPKKGLQQLTMDDLSMKNDAMENLVNDSPMSNLIHLPLSGDTKAPQFEIHGRIYEIPKPCIVFAATDGCFGYVDSPMSFEYLLLRSLEAEKMAENANSLGETILKNLIELPAADDCTLAGMILPDYLSMGEFNQLYQKRKSELYDNYIAKFHDLNNNPNKSALSQNIQKIKEHLISYQKIKTGQLINLVSAKLLAILNGGAIIPTAYNRIDCVKNFIDKHKEADLKKTETQQDYNRIYEKLLEKFKWEVVDINDNFALFLHSFGSPHYNEFISNPRKETLDRARDDFQKIQQYVQDILTTNTFDKIKYNPVVTKSIWKLMGNVYEYLFEENNLLHFTNYPAMENKIKTIKSQYKDLERDPNFKRLLDNFIEGKETGLTLTMGVEELRDQYKAGKKAFQEQNSLLSKPQKAEEIVRLFCDEHGEEIFQVFVGLIKRDSFFVDSTCREEIYLIKDICRETDRLETGIQKGEEELKKLKDNSSSSVRSLWNSYKVLYEERIN